MQTRRFTLPAERVPFFADDNSEVNMCGMFGMGQRLFADEPKITEAFKPARESVGKSTTRGSTN